MIKLFHRACANYGLLADGDRVLVALSGGKDSLMLTRLLAQQSRILKPRIEVEAVHVIMDNIPYETERTYLEQFCKNEGIKLTILHTSFDAERAAKSKKPHCFLCSWHRRKAIFQYATENNFNKVALGHHQDDFLVTMLLNLTYEGAFSSMLPSMPMRHYPITIIRPLCLIPENMIKEVAIAEGFQKQKTPCPYEHETKRTTMTNLLHQIEELNPEARYSMWHAMQEAQLKNIKTEE